MTNEKYSYKSFKRQKFIHLDPKEFDGEIIGSGFYQDEPYSNVFPVGITTKFIKCNLDNCNIPETATVEGGTNKHFKTMNDQEYWIVDKDLKPIEPRDKDRFIKCGLSVLPKDISATPLKESITFINDPKRIEREKIEALKLDEARLKQILIASGELPQNGGVK